ncbi:MAG: YajQ family cyclic di-GMP-binding protein [Candidatus Aminicenantes bacterium RBG_16_63_14]|nr:MAG: YajQ family cyclic di-GMP-binding protein [Candidatus Aminicenantes bacterium RBG_16_63_14]OGD26550.1 MAG: YajQ family cyclic di-GMP-binding protein [Candidatus Aminicenantes bacterium RBG_19FT_COMBO_65_30]
MGLDHSFDIVSRIDLQEVTNAVNITLKEIRNRFDFKNSRVDIVLEKEKLTLVAEDDFKIKALRTALEEKLVKRKVPLRALEYRRIEDGANRTVKQDVVFQVGIPIEKAREIVKLVKGEKFKAQVAIQGDEVRVSSAKIDVLQEVIAFLKGKDLGIHMQFMNYR